jgi:chemotaxis protein methyltransferase CheR
VDSYFTKRGAEYELAPTLRRNVAFRYLNLAVDAYPSLASGISAMDLVLCRNVLIYFDPETVARVARGLIASLGPDGWLVTGPSDPPLGDRVDCEVVLTPAGLVYRRPGRALSAAVTAVRGPTQIRQAVRQSDGLTAAPTHDRTSAPEAVPSRAPAPSVGPESPPPDALQQALRAYHAREYARAATAAEAATRIPAAAVTPWIVLVRSHANLGALDEAGRACAAALDRFRTSAELVYLHGVLLLESGRPAEAASALRQALYLDRGLVVAHLALAGALAGSGDAHGARRALRNAERLLNEMPADVCVPAADGERAGRLREAARAQLALLFQPSA